MKVRMPGALPGRRDDMDGLWRTPFTGGIRVSRIVVSGLGEMIASRRPDGVHVVRMNVDAQLLRAVVPHVHQLLLRATAFLAGALP